MHVACRLLAELRLPQDNAGMEVLWAPWRMEYVGGAAAEPQGCIFCDHPAAPEPEHRARLVLTAGADTAVLLNKYPYNNGHLLVVPRRHARWPDELSDAEAAALQGALWGAIALVRAVLRPDGLNVGMNLGRAAGAGIDAHLHWHVVPRWSGDVNFMPVVGQAKVMPEHVAATYDRLHAGLAALRADPGTRGGAGAATATSAGAGASGDGDR
jgi:ATP adenylyltransferase